jgi:hypothetical protein
MVSDGSSDRELSKTPVGEGTGKRELCEKTKWTLTGPGPPKTLALPFVAGWSSLVARQAHNLKVVGSNPTPAPN